MTDMTSDFYIDTDSVRIRIKEILSITGCTAAAFADRCQIPRTTISNILNDKTKATLDVLNKIVKACPDISSMWIYFGYGDKEVQPKDSQLSLSSEIPSTSSNQDNLLFGSSFNSEDTTNDYSGDPRPFSTDIPSYPTSSSRGISPSNMLAMSMPPESKKVEKIMVFYSDKSYETFLPANETDNVQ